MPSPTLNPLGVIVNLPDGTQWTIDIGVLAQTAGAVLAILVVAAIVIRLSHVFVRGIARALLNRENLEGTAEELSAVELEKRQNTIEALGVNVIRFFVVVIAGLMILETAFRLDVGPAIAGLGVAGIAIGLGTQSLVHDYLNGALIMMENHFAKGDVVRIAGVSGQVEDFTLRRTTLRDLDGVVHTVPNGQISVASNMTRVYGRVNLDVQVVYGTDIDLATEVMNRVGQEMAGDPEWGPRILGAPRVERVAALGELGIALKILGTVRASEHWAVTGELRKRLMTAFAASGIQVPHLQRVALDQAADWGIASQRDSAPSAGPGI